MVELQVVGSPMYINFYRCPDDGTEWIMEWDCACDDRCPACNHEIVPYRSKSRLPDGTQATSHED